MPPRARDGPAAPELAAGPVVAPGAPGLRVRRAAPSDHAAIRDLLVRLDLDWAAADLASFRVAEAAGRLVGIAELRDLGGARLLSCVGVPEDLRGRGIGRALVEGVLAGVADDVWLYTVIPGFFAGLGFETAAARPPGVPPRAVYGCEGCDRRACRCMVRRAATPAWRPMRAADLAALAGELCAGGGETTCDLAPANLRIWRDCERPSFARRDGALCVRLDPHHEPPYVLEPVGDGDRVAALEACLRDVGRASRVRAEFAARLPPDRFDVVARPGHFDHVYDRRDVAELRGAARAGHRNRVRKFGRERPRHEVRALGPADRAAALAGFDRWARGGDDAARDGAPSLVCRRRALERAFEEFVPLRLTGAALVDGGELLGFALGSRVGETAIVHVLHADADVAGAHQTLLVEACRGAFAGAREVNLEEDLGLPGLRRTKASWGPVRRAEKCDVVLRRPPEAPRAAPGGLGREG